MRFGKPSTTAPIPGPVDADGDTDAKGMVEGSPREEALDKRMQDNATGPAKAPHRGKSWLHTHHN